MRSLMRLAAPMSICLVVMFGEVMAAHAAGTPATGSYSSTGISASYSYSPQDFSFPQISISLSDATNVNSFATGPGTSTHSSQVFISVFDGVNYSQGCFLLPPGSFAISSDLSSASLHLVFDAATPTCGFDSTFTDTQTIDVTWTGIGAANGSRFTSNSRCGTFHSQTMNSRSDRHASATATISPLLGQSYDADNASLDASDLRQQIEGSQLALCMVQPGRGAGPGPVPAGSYRLQSFGASQQLNDDGTGTFMSVFASTFVTSANPRVGPSTTSTNTTLRVNLFGATNGSGCYVLTDPKAFALATNVSGASVHITVDDSTPSCGPFSNTLPTPLTVDAVWAGIGPSSTTTSSTHTDCAGYRTDMTSSIANNNTSAVATLSGAISESFVSHQSEHESTGNIGSSDSLTVVTGTLQQGCS